jgi:hypothetical protein
MKNLAQAIPDRIRQVIYSILGTAVGIEAIFDVIPAGVETKILAVLVVLGFGTAALNVERPTLPPPPPPAA